MEHTQILKNTTFDHCRQKFTHKKTMTKKGQKFEKWDPETINDYPISLFLLPLRAKTLLSWQMMQTAHHFLFVQAR